MSRPEFASGQQRIALRNRRPRSVLRAALAAAVVVLALVGPPRHVQAADEQREPSAYPALRWRLDAPILAAGTSLLIASRAFDVDRRIVPPEGLDPGDIHWSFDRSIIGRNSVRADEDSDYYRNAVVAYPVVLALIGQPSGTRLNGTLRRSLVYTEAVLVAEGIVKVIKRTTDRPRPFTYLADAERPDEPAYDVSVEQAFRSMPSGHAAISLCAAGFAMTDQLLARPEASWQERTGLACLGGFLAGMATGLRVEGGQHFPSDVITGGLIGMAAGVAVPLSHHHLTASGRRGPQPSGRAWWQAVAGEVVGIGFGLLAASTY